MASNNDEAEEEAPAPPPPPQSIFHLDLHAWIDAQQSSQGLRQDNFAQYHAYLTRRLKRLSHQSMETKRALICSNKFSTAPNKHNKQRHAYCSRLEDSLTQEYVPHENVLWYLLALSERAWAQSRELAKLQAKRQRVLGKLQRAVKWSTLLEEKSKVATDSTTQLECTCYAAWMKANYVLEKFDYSTAIEHYGTAMKICYELCKMPSSSEAYDEAKEGEMSEAARLQRHDLFVTRADTLLRPLFRYCRYELQQAGEAVNVEEPRLEKGAQTQHSSGQDEATVVFRETELQPLESKEIRVLLLKWRAMEDQQPTEEAFLNGLSILDDALDILDHQVAALGKSSSKSSTTAGPAIQAKLQQYSLWKGYLQYQKTRRIIEHTNQLLQQVQGHAERVHVYDALLQHTKSLLELPRPEHVEEDDEFALQAQANLLRLRCLKTLEMAWYYLQTKNLSKAFSLLEHSETLCKRAQEEIAACDDDMPHQEEYLQDLEALPYSSARAALQAAQAISQLGGASQRNTQRPLLLRLRDNDAGSVLASGLDYMPIPGKPVFYDLALYEALDTAASLDPIQDFVEKHTVPEEESLPQEDAGAAKSFLGRLFG